MTQPRWNRFVPMAALLAAIGAATCAFADRQQSPAEFIQVPNARRPPRLPGGLPPTCKRLLATPRRAHWEAQRTLFSHLERVRGVTRRVADAQAVLFARPDLGEVTLDAYTRAPQAIAHMSLLDPHNALRAGSYCVVLTYDPKAPDTRDENDPRRWSMYLYDYARADAPAVAWIPFLSRVSAANDSTGHPGTAPAPYPPLRFEYLPFNRGARSGGSLDPQRDDAAGNTERGAMSSMALQATAGGVGTWGWCGSGCCSGVGEALRMY